MQTLADAAALLLDHAATIECKDVVVVGSGYIGLEMAGAFVQRGARVTVVEAGPQPMRTLDEDMGASWPTRWSRPVPSCARHHGRGLRAGHGPHLRGARSGPTSWCSASV